MGDHNHINNCAKYAKFIDFLPGKIFKCTFCPFTVVVKHSMMYQHLRENHGEEMQEQPDQHEISMDIEESIHTGAGKCEEMYGKLLQAKAGGSFLCKLCGAGIAGTDGIEHLKSVHHEECGIILPFINNCCQHCFELLPERELGQHQETCAEAAHFVDGKLCLICKLENKSRPDALKHVKEKHDIAVVPDDDDLDDPDDDMEEEELHSDRLRNEILNGFIQNIKQEKVDTGYADSANTAQDQPGSISQLMITNVKSEFNAPPTAAAAAALLQNNRGSLEGRKKMRDASAKVVGVVSRGTTATRTTNSDTI